MFLDKIRDSPAFEIFNLASRKQAKGEKVFSLALGAICVLGSARWAEMDPKDPGRVFAREVFTTLRAQKPWFSRNGHRLAEVRQKIWGRLNRRPEQPKDQE